ncbi:hypothetical protein TI01_0001 [Lysobacter sp. A03]|nr:hypothetical protein TI01_0001 [Lysobacter sp. A03]
MQVQQPAQAEIQDHAADHAAHAHRQRQVEAVPHGQAVIGHVGAQHTVGRRGQHRRDRPLRHDAHRDAGDGEDRDRHLHEAGRLTDRQRHPARAFAEKRLVHEAQAVGDAKHGEQECRYANADPRHVMALDLQRLGEKHLLGQEAVEQRDAGHGQRGDDRQRTGPRQVAAQVAQQAHVASAGFVVDDAGRHEQRRLEGRVVEDVEQSGDHRKRRRQPEQQGDQAQVGDRRVGQQPLEVVLEDRVPGAQQERDRTDATDHVEEDVGPGQHRMQPHQQEYAGLHHRRRVQVGRHRGGCRHRMRKPELERELRALGEHAQQDQPEHPRIQRVGADQVARRQHNIQLVAAHHVADHDHAGQQRQSAAGGDSQRHPGAFARILALRPEPDQQEGADRGQLPEHRQQQQVAGQDHAQHRAHEQQQEREEALGFFLRAEVVVRIHHHQPADTQHHRGEHPGQPVQAQGERQPQLRDPRHAPADDLAGDQLRRHGQHRGHAGQWSDPRHPGQQAAISFSGNHHQSGENERQG